MESLTPHKPITFTNEGLAPDMPRVISNLTETSMKRASKEFAKKKNHKLRIIVHGRDIVDDRRKCAKHDGCSQDGHIQCEICISFHWPIATW